MILYHFCCEKDMRGIRNHGITKGVICGQTRIRKPGGGLGEWQIYMRPGWQWLTMDSRKEAQSWNTHVMISYDRTAYRWTVEIPEDMRSQLYDMDRLAKEIPGTEDLFNGWDGSENWRVYRGPIPRKWLKKLVHWDKMAEEWEEIPWRGAL